MGFTATKAKGFWQGHWEKSLVTSFVTTKLDATVALLRRAAAKYVEAYDQESVLLSITVILR